MRSGSLLFHGAERKQKNFYESLATSADAAAIGIWETKYTKNSVKVTAYLA
jgi:hypothetical protein